MSPILNVSRLRKVSWGKWPRGKALDCGSSFTRIRVPAFPPIWASVEDAKLGVVTFCSVEILQVVDTASY
jgi:hypothetical protein